MRGGQEDRGQHWQCNAPDVVQICDEHNGHARLLALLDNLGKGASGAVVQNLNLMLGLEESAGL